MRADATASPWTLAASAASTVSDTPAFETADDVVLVEAARRGDATAFDHLVTRHRRAVYQVCYRFVHQHEDAADLTQDTFVRAWKSLANFRGEARFSTWIHRIAVNVSLNRVSLKTPVAVLRSRLEAAGDEAALRAEVDAQVRRMNDLVSYQLARAARSGHQLFAAPVEIEPQAEQIVVGLEKVYASKGVLCEFEIAPEARFHGETGDLQELLGNLLENAFKWAKARVLLTVAEGEQVVGRRPGLRIVVEDDGPGIADERIGYVLQRGVRGDERVQGHGIGLSIVQDIIKSYRGELRVGRSQELGGARFEVELPPGL